MFVVQVVFRESDVFHSFKMVEPVLFMFGSHGLYSRDLQFFLMILLLILSSLVYPFTILSKRISAASRRVMSRFVVTHVSLP
jgi:NADH:ubiquinone oxidoreductase subunit K